MHFGTIGECNWIGPEAELKHHIIHFESFQMTLMRSQGWDPLAQTQDRWPDASPHVPGWENDLHNKNCPHPFFSKLNFCRDKISIFFTRCLLTFSHPSPVSSCLFGTQTAIQEVNILLRVWQVQTFTAGLFSELPWSGTSTCYMTNHPNSRWLYTTEVCLWLSLLFSRQPSTWWLRDPDSPHLVASPL